MSPSAMETYRQPVEAVLSTPVADAKAQLRTAEATARLKQYGRNALAAESPALAWRRLLAQFQDQLVILLLDRTP